MKEDKCSLLTTSLTVTCLPSIFLAVLFGRENITNYEGVMLIVIIVISVLINSVILKIHIDSLK